MSISSIRLLSNIYDDCRGKIGIGTSLPINNSLLSVNGPISINGVIYNSYATGKSLPSTGTIGIGSLSDGTKIVLYPGSSDVYPFAFGIGTSTLWYSVPNENTHNWYIGGTSYMNLSSFSLIVNTNIISSLQGSINNNTYTWYNNSNTGLYQPATNTIGFSAGANDVMSISPSNIIMNSNIIFKNNNIFQGGPIKSLTGGIDDKIILASATDFNNQPDYPFSIGYSSSNVWTSIPSWGSNTFYVGGSSLMNITSDQLSINGNLILNGKNIIDYLKSSTDINTINLTGTSPSISLGSTNSYNLSYVSVNGNFSSSSIVGDLVLRSKSGTNLLLQSGTNGSSIKIYSNNDVIISGNTTIYNKNLTISGGNIIITKNNISDLGSGNINMDGFIIKENISGIFQYIRNLPGIGSEFVFLMNEYLQRTLYSNNIFKLIVFDLYNNYWFGIVGFPISSTFVVISYTRKGSNTNTNITCSFSGSDIYMVATGFQMVSNQICFKLTT